MQLASALPTLLDKALPVTDLGCGLGYYVNELHKKGYTVTAVEGTPEIETIAMHSPILQADLSEPLTLDIPKGLHAVSCFAALVCTKSLATSSSSQV